MSQNSNERSTGRRIDRGRRKRVVLTRIAWATHWWRHVGRDREETPAHNRGNLLAHAVAPSGRPGCKGRALAMRLKKPQRDRVSGDAVNH